MSSGHSRVDYNADGRQISYTFNRKSDMGEEGEKIIQDFLTDKGHSKVGDNVDDRQISCTFNRKSDLDEKVKKMKQDFFGDKGHSKIDDNVDGRQTSNTFTRKSDMGEEGEKMKQDFFGDKGHSKVDYNVDGRQISYSFTRKSDMGEKVEKFTQVFHGDKGHSRADYNVDGRQISYTITRKSDMGEEGEKNRQAFLGDEEYFWVDYNGDIPSQAVKGGFKADKTPIYVGRATHINEVLPASCLLEKKVGSVSHGLAYVTYGTEVHCKEHFQVLCIGEKKVRWQASSKGKVSNFALKAGKTAYDEPLYVGRVRSQGSLTIGKVHPSHGCCYIPFDGKELNSREYEVLELIP